MKFVKSVTDYKKEAHEALSLFLAKSESRDSFCPKLSAPCPKPLNTSPIAYNR
jgi:dsDNA-binding SOS-regulon protein